MDLGSRLRRRLSWKRLRQSFTSSPASRPFSEFVGFDFFSNDRGILGADLLKYIPTCDVINIHWIAGFIDYQAFFSTAPKLIPVVWTLHDMNTFTGGCHYDHGCGRYVQRCGLCPQLGFGNENDLSRVVWNRKRRVFAGVEESRLHIVTPSGWLAAEAQRSPLLSKFPLTIINNGLDLEVFAPRDRDFARSVLGVPSGASVVLFIAHAVDDKRKGFALLAEALNGLKEIPDLYLLSIGKGSVSVPEGIRHMHLGSVADERFLSVVYSAANIFVIPSLQDNLPLTALEAMACGTPVIGFDVGGIPEIVRHRMTGLLVPPEDVAALRLAIIDLLQNPDAQAEMSASCRRVAIKDFSLEMQSRRYADVYDAVVRGLKPQSLGEANLARAATLTGA
jgi:glycosyltransferase involved in cell wall biosynthesis